MFKKKQERNLPLVFFITMNKKKSSENHNGNATNFWLLLIIGAMATAGLIIGIVTLVTLENKNINVATPVAEESLEAQNDNVYCLETIQNLDSPTDAELAGCPMASLVKSIRGGVKNAIVPPPPAGTNDESLKVLVERILTNGLADLKQNAEYQQWVELGLTKCRDDVGATHLYNFSTYKKLELNAIINFDALGQQNIYFYPGLTGNFITGAIAPAAPFFVGNKLDPEAFVKDVSITTALGFTLNISMLDTDFATDSRITLFLKNLRDRGYLIDSNGIRRDNYEKRRYMAGLSMKMQMNRFLPKIDLLVDQVYNDITIYKRSVLGAYDDRLLTFFLSTHVGDRHYPEYIKSFFKNFSFIVSSWLPSEPLRNESILYNNANADCVIQFFRECAVDILRTGDTTTLMYYWQAAGMSPETTVTEAMHNWIAYRQFMHITDLVIEHSLDPRPRVLGGPWTFNTSATAPFPSMFELWGNISSNDEVSKVNMWREMMRTLLPNNAWFSRVPNGTNPAGVNFRRAVHIPALIQGRAFVLAGRNPGAFDYTQYGGFNMTLSEFVNQSLTVSGRKDYILFNNSDTPAYLQEQMRRMGVSGVDNETIFHEGEEKAFPVFPTPRYAAFGLGWRACAGQNMVTVYGVRFMDRFFRLRFYKNESITSPRIPQAPLKFVPDNLFVDQNALKNMV